MVNFSQKVSISTGWRSLALLTLTVMILPAIYPSIAIAQVNSSRYSPSRAITRTKPRPSPSSTTNQPTSPTITEDPSLTTTQPTSPTITETPASPTTTQPTSPAITRSGNSRYSPSRAITRTRPRFSPTPNMTEIPMGWGGIAPTTTQPISPTTTQPISPTTTQPISPTATQPLSPTTTQPISPTATQPLSPTTTQSPLAAEVLAAHNRYRAEVGVPPLTWSDSLANNAQTWANYLASSGRFEHSTNNDRPNQGENLARGTSGAYTPTQLVDLWGDEKRFFIPGIFPNVSSTGNWTDVGHYTQIIWRNTQQVGCAIATGGGSTTLVCRYTPPGNVSGQATY